MLRDKAGKFIAEKDCGIGFCLFVATRSSRTLFGSTSCTKKMKRFSIKTLLLLTFSLALGLCFWNYRIQKLRAFHLGEPNDVCFHYQTEFSGRPVLPKNADGDFLLDLGPGESKLIMFYVDTETKNGYGQHKGSGIDVHMEIHRNDLGKLSVMGQWDNHLTVQHFGHDVRLLWTAENIAPNELQFNFAIIMSHGGISVDTKSGAAKLKLSPQGSVDAT